MWSAVRVRGDEQVDLLHTKFPQERHHVAGSRINQRRLPSGRLDEHGVALAHVQEDDPEDRVGGRGWGRPGTA